MATPDASSNSSKDEIHDGISDRDSPSGIATANSSLATSISELGKPFVLLNPGPRIDVELAAMFSENAAAKIWRAAASILEQENPPQNYPEFIPVTSGKYTLKPADFWTCGFFPGCLYALLERSMKYPKYLPSPKPAGAGFQTQLLQLCRSWSDPLHRMASRTNTHDLGFILQPAFRMDWELTGNPKSLETIVTGANSLASRYGETVGAIRSWDRKITLRDNITDRENNFLVIIDSMCNLDLLFYAGHHTSNQKMIDIATSHAHAVLRSIVREDSSTFHVANFDPKTGAIKHQMTHQGYQDSSTWSRGQAWGILGFTQTYIWTKDLTFLHAAIRLANFFLAQLSSAEHSHPYVPAWDFNAPKPAGEAPLRDSSAGLIAANGLLLLHQILHNNSPYLEAVLRIARETVELSLSPDVAKFSLAEDGKVSVAAGSWDGILMHSTANNNEHAMHRYSDHGLVYAEYYFLELGNKLLRMGLV